MATKMVFSLPTDCYCCPGLEPACDKIAYQCNRSYPSMVQINAFQTSEFSAFTLYKKRDDSSQGSNTVCRRFDDTKAAFVRWASDGVPHFHWRDEDQEKQCQRPVLHPRNTTQSTSVIKEGKATTQESSPVTEDTKARRSDKKQKCLFCGKFYARSSTLRIHMRIHLGVKPYRCPYCQKAFTQSGNRTTHMRIHTGAKPYVCTRCGKGFSQSSALKSHMLTHK